MLSTRIERSAQRRRAGDQHVARSREDCGHTERAVDQAGYHPPGHLSMSLCSRAPLRVTGEVTDVAPHGSYRYLRTAPVIFSEVDPHLLYLGAQVVLKTTDGGENWQPISPDLHTGTGNFTIPIALPKGTSNAKLERVVAAFTSSTRVTASHR